MTKIQEKESNQGVNPQPQEILQSVVATDTLVDIIDVVAIRTLFFEKLGQHPDKLRIVPAVDHAQEALKNRTRNKGSRKGERIPDVVHAGRVAVRMLDAGSTDADGLILAWEHDLIEDTSVTEGDIKERFGGKVARWVKALTRPVKGKKDEGAKKYFKGIAEEDALAQSAKVGDRIDNLWALLRMDYDGPFNQDKPDGKTAGEVLEHDLRETDDYFGMLDKANEKLVVALKEVVAVCRVRVSEHTAQARDPRMNPSDQPAA